MANYLQCPNCGVEIPWRRKVFLGSRRGIQCSSCSSSVSTSRVHTLALSLTGLFVLFLILNIFSAGDRLLQAIACLFLILLITAYHVLYVPLVIKSTPS